MSAAEEVKILIEGSNEEKLEVIERLTRLRLAAILGGIDPIPEKLEYIVTDICIKRFNRIGNEGMSSYSQEGQSMTFPDSDFDEYQGEINAFLEEQAKTDENYGKVRFI